MKREIQERMCDECGKKAQMVMERSRENTPFYGWIRATIENENGITHPLDFCSTECAGKHFTLFKVIPNATLEPQGKAGQK